MRQLIRNIAIYPPIVGGAVLWGVLEFVALRRAQSVTRELQKA